MPVTLTKKEINDLLVSERKKSRTRQQQSAFMKRTLQIYNGDKGRIREETGDPKAELPYTLAELRELVQDALGKQCPYNSKIKLSVANLAVDHDIPLARGGSWDISNLMVISQQSNYRKGQLTGAEWMKFSKGLDKNFPPEAIEDVYRRLSLGGKWIRTQ